jgi:hypothetical protein
MITIKQEYDLDHHIHLMIGLNDYKFQLELKLDEIEQFFDLIFHTIQLKIWEMYGP